LREFKESLPSEDKFLLHWHNLLREYLRAEMAQLLRSTVRDVGGKRVLVVQCGRSPRPVFFGMTTTKLFMFVWVIPAKRSSPASYWRMTSI
jgi:hypothetical protein